MKSLRVKDGDLVLTLGGKADVVTGKDKLFQQMRLWLLEPYGASQMTPLFGSRLWSYIGSTSPEEYRDTIEDEIVRVLTNFQAHQLEQLRWAESRGLSSLYSNQEILNSVDEVVADVRGTAVTVMVRITTLADETLQLPLALTPSGLQVA